MENGEMLSNTKERAALSKAIKQYGFRFVGPTTCYALMQSVGMVIDHPVNSPEWNEAHRRLQQRPKGYQ
jgi:DNA-3-methyladenine glycosylase I